MEKLQFLQSFTIAEFKAHHGVESIDILKNEKTGKCFFSYGLKSGAVTTKYPGTPLTKPMISEVSSEDSGEVFYLLHNKGEHNATKLETL